jgi:LAO/AO transport system kinase
MPGTSALDRPAQDVAESSPIAALMAGNRRALAKAITLVESTRSEDREAAQKLLEAALPHTGRSMRIGISGVPGVGKSTFIEALGMYLIERGHRVAVLAVDPSSTVHGGSILGDKTRMELLSQRTEAFIRPSPSSGSLGGVAEHTREALLLCEAAGYDIIIVETVGVGQSETAVAGMTDAFVLLQLPNAGDELQAIKKGIMELADLVVFNKADIDPTAAQMAAAQMRSALSMLRSASANWQPPVLTLSALKKGRPGGVLAGHRKIPQYADGQRRIRGAPSPSGPGLDVAADRFGPAPALPRAPGGEVRPRRTFRFR